MTNQSQRSQPPHHAWMVLVRDGRVAKRYRADEVPADISATMPTALCGDAVEVWSVDPQQPEPPAEGEHVDPLQPGWTCISDRDCSTDHSERNT